jgi:hypothetical protein
LAYHVLEAMTGILDAAASGRFYDMTSTVERPEPLGHLAWEMRDDS